MTDYLLIRAIAFLHHAKREGDFSELSAVILINQMRREVEFSEHVKTLWDQYPRSADHVWLLRVISVHTNAIVESRGFGDHAIVWKICRDHIEGL